MSDDVRDCVRRSSAPGPPLARLSEAPRAGRLVAHQSSTGALREHATPRNAEAIRTQAQRVHQVDIALEAPIMVAGDVAGIAVDNAPWCVYEAMPDARPRAVRERRAFDLVRGRSAAPQEALWKARGRSIRTHGVSLYE